MPTLFSLRPRMICFLLAVTLGNDARSERLVYSIKPQQVVPYTVTITAQMPTAIETMKGTIALTGKSQEDDKLVVQYSGGLTKTTTLKSSGSLPGRGGPRFGGPRMGLPPIPRGPFDRPDYGGLAQANSTLVISRTGEIESLRGETQLPYLLGHLALLPFESLPETEREAWQAGHGLTITEKSSSDSRFGPRFGPFASDDGDERIKTGGHETASYQIKSVEQALVTITKTYALSSPASTKSDSAIETQGSGEWIFNQDEGISESMTFKATMTVTSNNTEVKIPLSIQWQRMPEAEYQAQIDAKKERLAKLQEEAAARRAKEQAAAKERAGKPLDAEEKRTILADLNSSHWPATANRLRGMASFHPHPTDFDIALRVKELCTHKVIGVSMPAKKLWERLEPILEAAGPIIPNQPDSWRAMRTWSDLTGSFQVQAEFMKLAGDNIVLRRDDGKEMTVPIARLSEADQTLVKQIQKAEADLADPANPFK